jgi:hypothetical protein
MLRRLLGAGGGNVYGSRIVLIHERTGAYVISAVRRSPTAAFVLGTHRLRLGILRRKVALMSVINRPGYKHPWPQGLLAIKCTGPAMRLQSTVDQTLICGLVTRSDRCSSGGFLMSRAAMRLQTTRASMARARVTT